MYELNINAKWDQPMIQSVVNNKKVALCVVTNTSTFITINVWGNPLGLEIQKDVSIPRVIRGNESQMFIRQGVWNFSSSSRDNSKIISTNTIDCFNLAYTNLNSNLYLTTYCSGLFGLACLRILQYNYSHLYIIWKDLYRYRDRTCRCLLLYTNAGQGQG